MDQMGDIMEEGRMHEIAAKALQYKNMDDHDILITATVKMDLLIEQNKKAEEETGRWRNQMDGRLNCAEDRLIKHDVYFAFLGGFVVFGIPFFVWLMDSLFFR
jgi:hypothetical protein